MEGSADSVSKICLFVRNLPYSVSDGELEKVFQPYGAIKSCYTVKDKGPERKSRGFAYVTFVNREDAQKAKVSVKMVERRPVQVEFAKRKLLSSKKGVVKDGVGVAGVGGAAEHESSDEEEDYEALTARTASVGTTKKQRKARSQRGRPKFDIGRVAVIQNIPAEGKEKRLRKKCEKFGQVDEIIFPANSDPQKAHMTFSTHKAARLAVKELNDTKYKKSAEGVLKVSLLSQESKSVSNKTLKKSRIIVRNLSFKCEQEDVKREFERFGSVLRVDIPVKENGYKRGYAFVQFGSYFDAANAIAEMNDTEIKGRKVGVDWLFPKSEYRDKQETSGCGQEGEGEGSGGEEVESEEEDAVENEEEDAGSEEELDTGSDEEDAGSMNETNTGSEEEGVETGSEEEDAGSELEMETGSEEDTGSEDEADSGSEEEDKSHQKNSIRKKLFSDDVNEGKTLFIRDLPFNTDQQALKNLFVRFGLVRYCRVMVSQATGVTTGSAFIQFRTPAAARKCLQASECADKGVLLDGQRLSVTVALPQRELEKRRKEGAEKREKEDKRNLYLSREGAIFPDSDAARGVSKADMLKRTKAYAEKKAKLAKPHYYVSRTRLCARNLPTSVDERRLKALFQQAASNPKASVLQVKVMRSKERVDVRGVGRSMGYGFVEFTDHDSALSALRATNNNPDLFGKDKRPIVDFAVEDSRIMKIREKRLAKQQSLQQQKAAVSGEGVASQAAESARNDRSLKRQKWQLKWQARRVRRREQSLGSGGERNSKAADRAKLKPKPSKHPGKISTPDTPKQGVRGRNEANRKSRTSVELPFSKHEGFNNGRKRGAGEERGGLPKRRHLEGKGTRVKLSETRVKLSEQRERRKIAKRRATRDDDTEERRFSKMVEKYREKLSKIG